MFPFVFHCVSLKVLFLPLEMFHEEKGNKAYIISSLHYYFDLLLPASVKFEFTLKENI